MEQVAKPTLLKKERESLGQLKKSEFGQSTSYMCM
jgi:hypothetical protein